MTSPLRWGIAGTGGIAAQMTQALGGLADAQVVAVGSRSAARAQEFAAEHGIERWHESCQALFEDPEVDIVHIASPPSTHVGMTCLALELGKHVLCEKPFALNASEARTMVETAKRSRRFLMEGMWMWFLPPIVEVCDRLRAGEIGELRVVQADFGRRLPPGSGWHHDLALGGGALIEMGVYPVALSRLILGRPTEVCAVGRLGPTGVDVNVGAVLNHDNGALAVIHCGLDAYTSLTAQVFGTTGSIAIDAPFSAPTGYRVRRHDGDLRALFDPMSGEHVSVAHDGLRHEAMHAMARIRAGALASDVISWETSIEVVETLDEIRRQIGTVYSSDRPTALKACASSTADIVGGGGLVR
jgi:predicted dehydrogenase